jgi:hypothetical protein
VYDFTQAVGVQQVEGSWYHKSPLNSLTRSAFEDSPTVAAPP